MNNRMKIVAFTAAAIALTACDQPPQPVRPVQLTAAQRMHDDKCLLLGGICPWQVPGMEPR